MLLSQIQRVSLYKWSWIFAAGADQRLQKVEKNSKNSYYGYFSVNSQEELITVNIIILQN